MISLQCILVRTLECNFGRKLTRSNTLKPTLSVKLGFKYSEQLIVFKRFERWYIFNFDPSVSFIPIRLKVYLGPG